MSLAAIHFHVPGANCRPSDGQIFLPKLGFCNVLKKILAELILYLAFNLLWCVSWPLFIFLFLPTTAALVVPNIARKGSPEFLTPWPSGGQHDAGIFLENSLREVCHWCSTHTYCKTGIFVEYFWISRVVIKARVYYPHILSTLRPEQCHFTDSILKCILMKKIVQSHYPNQKCNFFYGDIHHQIWMNTFNIPLWLAASAGNLVLTWQQF